MRALLVLMTLLAGCATMSPSQRGSRYLRIENSSTHIAQVYYIRDGQRWRLTSQLGIGEERTVRVPATAMTGGAGVVQLAVEFLDGLMDMSRRYEEAMQPFTAPRPCYVLPVRIGTSAADVGPVGPEVWAC